MADMNDLIRFGGRGAATGSMADDTGAVPAAKGSQDFTVQEPGTHSPTDQFVYEPDDDKPGAWVVYPPGVPCDTEEYRISRSTPADVPDFPKMQSALDDSSAGSSEAAEPSEEAVDSGSTPV